MTKNGIMQMEQMETMINRLQAENAQAEDHLQEEKMRHSHRITIMNKEVDYRFPIFKYLYSF